MKIVASLLFLCLLRSAFAQVDWRLTAYYNAFQDTSQTLKFKDYGYYELNPLMEPFKDDKAFIIVTSTVCAYLDKLAQKSDLVYPIWGIIEGIMAYKNAKKPGLGHPPVIWFKVKI